MSSQRRTHNLTKFLPVLIGAMAVFLLSLAARAATITGYSDLVTRLAVNVQADHEIKFVTPTGVDAPTDTVTVSFDNDFDLSAIVTGDIDLAIDTSAPTNDCTGAFTDKTLAAAPGLSPNWGVGVAGRVITFTAPTDAAAGEIPADTCVRVLIGQNASSGAVGTHRIVNPSGAFAHAIGIGGTFGDSGLAYVLNNDSDQVTVTADVAGAGGGGGGGGGGTPNPPTIFNVRTQNITETEADVLWDTDISSTSIVNYGLTVAYGSSASTLGSTFNHSVHLTGLAAGTTYHFRVRSTGLGTAETISGDFTFTTPDTNAPVISNVSAVLITGTSARIVWDTNEDSTSKVDYGTALPYASSVSDAALVNTHAVQINGLTPSTTYHYKVTSKDAANNSASSADFTFTTADTIAPNITNIFVDAITQTTARLNWATDELADSTARYGLTDAYGSSVANANLVANHQITLNGLASGTLYHFSVSSADAMANGATSTDQTFTTLPDTTPPANVSNFVVTPGNTQNPLSWTNPNDPDFAGVKIQRSTIDYPATQNVGVTIYDGAGNSTINVGLVNGVKYYYSAFAYDNSGNFATGAVANGTPFDAIPPGQVSNFVVTAGNAQNTLNWTNPNDADFSGVQIQRSTTGFPAVPGQGITVYVGAAQTYLDPGLLNGTTYYYSIFARDTSGNFSAPAQASGTPVGPVPGPICGNAVCEAPETIVSCPADCLVVPPPPAPFCGNAVCDPGETNASCPADCPPPAQPPVIPPPPSAPSVNRTLIRVFALNRTLELHQNAEREYRILPDRSLTIFVPLTALPSSVMNMTLNFTNGSFLFARTAQSVPEEGYVVDVSAPHTSGKATATIIVKFDNGTTDVIEINVRVESLGSITETKNGQKLPLDGATITLQKRVGDWITWDAILYRQINPVGTGIDGTFAYMAPSGQYRLVAKKNGYREYASAPLDLTTEVINPAIELIALPPSVTDVFIPGAPVIENIGNVAKALGAQGAYVTKILQNEIILDPRVKNATTQVLVPTAAAITTAAVATAVQATSLVSYIYFLLTQPLLLLGRRQRKQYGTVYNALTKLPVDLASVRLIRTSTNRLVRTVVTDKLGRYAFIVEQGEYRIEATKPGYSFPTRFLVGRKEDAEYLDLYHGEKVTVSEEGAVITANIPLDPTEIRKSNKRLFVDEIVRRLQSALAFSSVIFTLIAALLYQRLYLYILVGAQFLLYLLFRRLASTKRPKNWGIIYDERTKKPIPFAVARIIEAQYNKTLESRIADSKGRYNFLVGTNKYYVTVEKPGYEPAKTNEIDLTTVKKEGGVVSRDIPMREKSPE